MADIGCGHKFMSNDIFLSHSAYFLATVNAINSNSIVEYEIHVCFFDAQEMAPPPRVNTQPDVDLLSLIVTYASNSTSI
jgi:hypothetical protein